MNARKAREQLSELLSSFQDAMLVTRDDSGFPRGRPMRIAHHDEDEGVLWFIASDRGVNVREIRRDPRVCAILHGGEHYLSLSGRAEVVTDRATLTRIWDPSFELFFLSGIDDPSLVLLRVDVAMAELWDGTQLFAERVLARALEAWWKGEEAELPDEGHTEIRYRGNASHETRSKR